MVFWDTFIYLAALAGAYLDILFRGVDLLTDNHAYTQWKPLPTHNRLAKYCMGMLFTNILSM